MKGKYTKGDVNIYTDTCKKCGYIFTYKTTNIPKGCSMQMRLHNKTCAGKPISEEQLKKIMDHNLKTMKINANNTVSETIDEYRVIYHLD